MYNELRQVFLANDPEVVLISYLGDHEACLQLMDCDGYRVGKMICKEIYTICLTTRWDSYSEINFYTVKDLPPNLLRFQETFPEDFILITLKPTKLDEPIPLPIVDGNPLGYIIC